MASGKMSSPPAGEEQPSTDIDDLHLMLQAEQENTQKRTFTNWVNSQLAKHIPPSAISDLFADFRGGHVLLDLLEVLSGEHMPREKGNNIFQCRSNVESALTFLESKSIKLINIHVADIIDGKPSIVLGLVWTIILHFHIQKLASSLESCYSQPLVESVSSLDASPTASPPAKRKANAQSKWKISAKKALLMWVKEQCTEPGSVSVSDFTSSWKNGLAFLAIINALRPDLIDMEKVKCRSNKENLDEAFRIAECELKIPRLLEPEDVDVANPDEKSIMTYVAQFLQYSKEVPAPEKDLQEEVNKTINWLTLEVNKLKELFIATEHESYYKRYQEILLFMRQFNEQKRTFMPVLSSISNQDELTADQLLIRQKLENLTLQIADWKEKLDRDLPPPLSDVETWLQMADRFLFEVLPESEDHHPAVDAVQGLLDSYDQHLGTLQSFVNKDEQGGELVPADKLDEMKRRFDSLVSDNFSALLEYHLSRHTVLALLDQAKTKLDMWNVQHGTEESVESLLADWHDFIEEKQFLVQLEASFQAFKEMNSTFLNTAASGEDTQHLCEPFEKVESEMSLCTKSIHDAKTALQDVLSSWATYTENIHLLKPWLDGVWKEHPAQVPLESLSKWDEALRSINTAGQFLIKVSNRQMATQLSSELKKVNRRWEKFIKKTKYKMQPHKKELVEKVKSLGVETANPESYAKEARDMLTSSVDISAESLKRYIQSLKDLQSKGTEHDLRSSPESSPESQSSKEVLKEPFCEIGDKSTLAIGKCTELLLDVETFEEHIKTVERLLSESKQILVNVKLQECTDTPSGESLKTVFDRGSLCQEHVAAAEEKLQVVTRSIIGHAALQNLHTAGMQTQIQKVKDKAKGAMIELGSVMPKPEQNLTEKDVIVNFEECKKELETYITKAVQLLGQKISPVELISEYEKNLSSFDTKSLDRFLKAADQVKSISPAREQLAVEEVSMNLRKRWEVVHSEIHSYIMQLKILIEKGKCNELVSKLEAQINEENAVLSKGAKEEVIKGHEACFSENGLLGQLTHCLQTMREMCANLEHASKTERANKETNAAIAELEQKKDGIEKRAADLYSRLLHHTGHGKASKAVVPLDISENGERSEVPLLGSSGVFSPDKAPGTMNNTTLETEVSQQNGASCSNRYGEDIDVPLQTLVQSCDSHKQNLEYHLQNIRETMNSDFTEETQTVSYLQDKLQELQDLQSEADTYWKQFEATSHMVEKHIEDAEKIGLSDERDRLNREWSEVQMMINTRMKSLMVALDILLPIEHEASFLCESPQQPQKKEVEQFTLTDIDSIFQELKAVQSSLEDQIEMCDKLESSDIFVADEVGPLDLQAARNIAHQYKKQFEETNTKMHSSEAILKGLERFLSSLKEAKTAAEETANLPAMDIPALQENKLKVEALKEYISLMRDKAKGLDELLKTVDICLEDSEYGGNTSCEKLIAGFSEKLEELQQSIQEQEKTLQQKETPEAFFTRHNDLLKNILDIHSRITKIGLMDPTVHAVRLRIKSLIELEKELDSYEHEKECIKEIVNELLESKHSKGEKANELYRSTESLCEDIRLSIIECREQCEKVIELLRQFQSCKNTLTTVIEKQEQGILRRASYIRKENLQKTAAKFKTEKAELNNYAEDVDKMNIICKNLQFHMNQMRSFEEPPFEKEAHAMLDRWLDINEKMEHCSENLERALVLWDQLLKLTADLDEWAQLHLPGNKEQHLSNEDVEQLEIELQLQEKNIDEFNRKSAEIQHFLQSNEPPLELQVVKTSILTKMEQIRTLVESKPNEVDGTTVEHKKDLDLARAQLQTIESFLNTLPVSDSVDIFSTLEETHQQILHQKENLKTVQRQMTCPNPTLAKLQKHCKSVGDLLITKEHMFQDHFLNHLNDRQKQFKEWFSGAQLSIKECFEPSNTKQTLEEKLNKLTVFLMNEERDNLEHMKTMLSKVGRQLPEESVVQLSSWIKDQETELQSVTSESQTQQKELSDCLKSFTRLQEDYSNLSKWQTAQEKKLQDLEKRKKKLKSFHESIIGQREAFDSLAQLANSLKELGFTEEEMISNSSLLLSRYQTLLTTVCEKVGATPPFQKEDRNPKEVAQSITTWIAGVRESVCGLNSAEGSRSQLEERIEHLKEILLLKAEGDSKIEDLITVCEPLTEKRAKRRKTFATHQTLLDLMNQWEQVMNSATEQLSHLEKIRLQRDRCMQTKEEIRLKLTELKKKQDCLHSDIHHGLQEKQAQLMDCKQLLDDAEGLTPSINELKTQSDCLLSCTKDPCFGEELWLEIEHLHESLLNKLQVSVRGKEVSSEKILPSDISPKHITSSQIQETFGDEMKAHHFKQRDVEEGFEHAKLETENILSESLKLKQELSSKVLENGRDIPVNEELPAVSEMPIHGQEDTSIKSLEVTERQTEKTLEKALPSEELVNTDTSSAHEEIIGGAIETPIVKQRDLEERIKNTELEMKNMLSDSVKSIQELPYKGRKKDKVFVSQKEGTLEKMLSSEEIVKRGKSSPVEETIERKKETMPDKRKDLVERIEDTELETKNILSDTIKSIQELSYKEQDKDKEMLVSEMPINAQGAMSMGQLEVSASQKGKEFEKILPLQESVKQDTSSPVQETITGEMETITQGDLKERVGQPSTPKPEVPHKVPKKEKGVSVGEVMPAVPEMASASQKGEMLDKILPSEESVKQDTSSPVHGRVTVEMEAIAKGDSEERLGHSSRPELQMSYKVPNKEDDIPVGEVMPAVPEMVIDAEEQMSSKTFTVSVGKKKDLFVKILPSEEPVKQDKPVEETILVEMETQPVKERDLEERIKHIKLESEKSLSDSIQSVQERSVKEQGKDKDVPVSVEIPALPKMLTDVQGDMSTERLEVLVSKKRELLEKILPSEESVKQDNSSPIPEMIVEEIQTITKGNGHSIKPKLKISDKIPKKEKDTSVGEVIPALSKMVSARQKETLEKILPSKESMKQDKSSTVQETIKGEVKTITQGDLEEGPGRSIKPKAEISHKVPKKEKDVSVSEVKPSVSEMVSVVKKGGTLRKTVCSVDAVEQDMSLPERKTIEGEMETCQFKQTDVEDKLDHITSEFQNLIDDSNKSKPEFSFTVEANVKDIAVSEEMPLDIREDKSKKKLKVSARQKETEQMLPSKESMKQDMSSTVQEKIKVEVKTIAQGDLEEGPGRSIKPKAEISHEVPKREKNVSVSEVKSSVSEMPLNESSLKSSHFAAQQEGMEENFASPQRWLQRTRAQLEMYQNTQCDEEALTNKIRLLEAMHSEILQKKMDLDRDDSESKTVTTSRGLEGETKAAEQHEARIQVPKLLTDCESYKRQLESAQADLKSYYTDLNHVSSLVNALRKKLKKSKAHFKDPDEKVCVLSEVQPLYEEVQQSMDSLDTKLSQILSLGIPCKAEARSKNLRDKCESLNKELMEIRLPVSSEIQHQTHTGNAQKSQECLTSKEESLYSTLTDKQENLPATKIVSPFQKAEDTMMEGHNAPSPHGQKKELSLISGQQLAVEDGVCDELQQRWICYQQKLQEVLQSIRPLMNTTVIEVVLDSSKDEIPLQKQSQKIKSPNVNVVMKTMLSTEALEDAEQRVLQLKNQAAELNITPGSEHLQEVEKLYTEFERKKRRVLSLAQGVFPEETESGVDAGSLQHREHIASQWDRLLHELSTIKNAKHKQCNLVKSYNDALNAAKSTVKMLSVEKENMKMGPMESYSTYLERMQHFLDTMQSEKCILTKLKTTQGLVCKDVIYLDKELMESQVKQLGQWWEQTEELVENKQAHLAMEMGEFNNLMQHIKVIEGMLHAQQHLLEEHDSPQEDQSKESAFFTPELQNIRYNFLRLKETAELQMKRMCGQKEKETLETAVNNLQNQLELLEHASGQGELTSSRYSKKSKLTRSLKEAVSWVKDAHGKFSFDQYTALFPDDVRTEIISYSTLHKEILGKQSNAESLADEVKQITSEMNPQDCRDLTALLEELLYLHQALRTKSTQRLQQLETTLGKREALFMEIEKVRDSLKSFAGDIIPNIGKPLTQPELDQQLKGLTCKAKELQETQDRIVSLLSNSNGLQKELSACEQLFLTDQLRGLKNKANRMHRAMQNKIHQGDQKIRAHVELTNRANSLHQDLRDLQNNELMCDRREVLKANQEVKNKLLACKHKILAAQTSLSQILEDKEVLECTGLEWDSPNLRELPALCNQMSNEREEKQKQFDRLVEESSRYQSKSNEIKTMASDIQAEADALVQSFDFTAAQSLFQKVKKVILLAQEAVGELNTSDVLDTEVKVAESQQMKQLLDDMGRFHELLRCMAADLQPRCTSEQDFQRRVECALNTFKQIQSELHQPFLIDFKISHIQDEKVKYEALLERVQAELCGIQVLSGADEEGRFRKLDEVEALQTQLEADISLHINLTQESLKNVKRHENAVKRAAELLTEFELHVLKQTVSLDQLEQLPLPCSQMIQWNKEFDSTISEIQDLTYQLEPICQPKAKQQLQNILSALSTRRSVLAEEFAERRIELGSWPEKYHSYRERRQKISDNLNELEKVLRESVHQTPTSYKEALQYWEESKAMVRKMNSVEEDLMKLRQNSKQLCVICTESDRKLVVKTLSLHWDKWLNLCEAAKEWETRCEELKQDWKFITEELERETILLDHFQEELPEKAKRSARKEELLESLRCVDRYEKNLDRQQLLLCLLLRRVHTILSAGEAEATSSTQEILSLQDKRKNLSQKAQKNKRSVQMELQERDQIAEEINTVWSSLLSASSCLQDLKSTNPPEKATQLEELQLRIKEEQLKIEKIMEQIGIKYSTTSVEVPAEIEAQAEACRTSLQDLEDEVKDEVLQSSPRYVMNRKVEEINSGLQTIERMLQQKSKNIIKAKEIQKKIWDDLDTWHSKLNELDSDVQDIAEEDPGEAHELMDSLMVPCQLYQQVSKLAEHRTAQLNKAAAKLEEYDEHLRSTKTWIQNTNELLMEEERYDSAKSLSKYAAALQMALEDSEQKQNILHDVYSELDELSFIFETEYTVKQLNELSDQVTTLQKKIEWILPRIQHVTDDAVAIESEVKLMEKNVAKMKAILSSKDIVGFSPKEHLKHGQVILENLNSMKNTFAAVEACKSMIVLPEAGVQSLSVYRRTAKLLKQMEELETVTHRQNELLEPIIKEVADLDQEIEKLKQVSKNMSVEMSMDLVDQPGHEVPAHLATCPQEKSDHLRDQMTRLSKRKEEVLMGMQNAVIELLKPLQEERQEADSDPPTPVTPDEPSLGNRDVSQAQIKRKGFLFFMPSLEEVSEDGSVKSEKWYKPAVAADILQPLKEPKDQEEQGSSASGSSGTLADRIPQGGQGGVAKAPDNIRPESEGILHGCQAQVAELELWLDRAETSLTGKPDLEMQQVLEQQLADCQKMLIEIEQKVSILLEEGKDWLPQDNGGTQKEAEALSLKLTALKVSLEKFQVMLQNKPSDEQVTPAGHPSEMEKPPDPEDFNTSEHVISNGTTISRQNSLQQQKDLQTELHEQKEFTKYIAMHGEKIKSLLQYGDGTNHELYSSTKVPLLVKDHTIQPSTSKDQARYKWQYLQKELAGKIKPCLPDAEPQVPTAVTFSILPQILLSSVGSSNVEDLKSYTIQLGELSQEADITQTQKKVEQKASSNVDTKLFELFYGIIRCLNSVEEKLNMNRHSNDDAVEQLTHHENLTTELENVHTALTERKEVLLKSIASAGESTDDLSKCFTDTGAWAKQIQCAVASRSKALIAVQEQNSVYQNEIRLLYDSLIEKKAVVQQYLNEASGLSVAEQLQKTHVFELELQNYESKVAELRSQVEKLQLPTSVRQEVHKLEDVLNDAWKILGTRQGELNCTSISESQYAGLLHGIMELVEIGREKVTLSQGQQIKSIADLRDCLQNHEDFFHKLGYHILLMQTYARKIPTTLFSKREPFLSELVKEVTLLQQQAAQYGAHLQNVLKEWIEFDENYASLDKELETLRSTVPSVKLVEETEERLKERITLYQQIKRNIDEKHARLYQTVTDGKKVSVAVSCEALKTQISKLEGQSSSMSKTVNHDLHRLETLLKHLISYNKDADELTTWMESTHQKLNYWKQKSLNASQDLDTIRNNSNCFFELSKEVDERSSLKTSVIRTGNQLLRLKEADTATLRFSLAQYEQQWTELITELPEIQEKLHQLQMEKLSSRGAITELMAWMDQVEQHVRDEVPLNAHTDPSHVNNLLQEYKAHMRQMNHKQWIVDFVNQSLLQLTVSDVESNRYDRTEFAEHLGAMNLQWNRLRGSLNGKMQDLEQILETITDLENKVQTLSSWLDAQHERLNALQKPSSLISAQNTLTDCKDLENQLAFKSGALDDLKQNYALLKDKRALQDTAVKLENLYEKKDSIANQVERLKSSMQAVLQHWKVYDSAYDEVNMVTERLLHGTKHNELCALSLEMLRCRVENLQVLQGEAESNEENWVKLQNSANDLKHDCCPSVAQIIERKYDDSHSRWTLVNQDIVDQLRSAQALLQLCESYVSLCTEANVHLEQLEEKYSRLHDANIPEDKVVENLQQRMQDLNDLQHRLESIKQNCVQVSEVEELLEKRAHPVAMISENACLSQRISDLERNILEKSNEFKLTLNQLEEFDKSLERLQTNIKSNADALGKPIVLGKEESSSELLMGHMLELMALSPDIEHLNERSFKLSLSDVTLKAIQNLNQQWAQKTLTALEKCSELQRIDLEKRNFVEKCESWMKFLEKMENNLTMDIAGNVDALRKQQKTYEMFQAEISVKQQTLSYIVTQAVHLLETEEVEDRSKFILTLAALKEKWQSVIREVQQRKRHIDSLVKQWQHFNVSRQNLTKCISETNSYVSNQKPRSLYQTRKLIQELKNKQILLQRWETTCSLMVEAEKQIRSTADPEEKAFLRKELTQLQDSWKNAHTQLDDMIEKCNNTVQTWETCEKQITEQGSRLQDLKAKVNEPLPEKHDELQQSKAHYQELEQSLADWTQNLKELRNMKADLSHCIIAEDVIVLKEQVEHLHLQWEELCLRVSLRKQELEDRLNAWTVFNEKNKELCEWLTQMESKVLQTADVNIEEMIEKLQKDCVEEINLFSENKLHLKQMGDQLIMASNQTRSTEIDTKLSKINDRWQHLFDIIEGRVKKLKETFVRIQQLDKNMSNLRTWLARIECELSKPVVYDICDDQEIQRKLAEQQDLQQDIEQHSAGVASVLNICEHLLRDSDAYANETECDSIHQTTRSLDRRWRNICSLSMERRMKIEETWRLWQRFLDDYSRFEEWLNAAEGTAAFPNSAEVLYTNAKEELKKFEAFQRQIHERLTQLELINKQYRRLARENRTDSASKLKQKVHEGNHRWDNLQKRVAAILRRLRHFTNQRDEFEGTRDSILVWLTEMDLQLTNVEHFSHCDADDKIRQLNGFQQEITLNTNKIDQLIDFGEQLIQKSEPMDAVLIEDEIEELNRYCQEVFGRVSRFHQRLTNRNPGFEDEKETSENEMDSEDSREMQDAPWHGKAVLEGPASQQSLCHLMPPAPGHERSGRETPVSVDSIPLEWDHTVDVGGSSHEDEDEGEGAYYSALSGKPNSESHAWHSPDSQTSRNHQYQQTLIIQNVHPPSAAPETSTPYKQGYPMVVSDGSGDSLQHMPCELSDEDHQEAEGLVSLEVPDRQSGIIERWEIIHAQALSNELRKKQNLQQWQQLNSDLTAITAWLERTETDLDCLQREKPASSIQETETSVKKLKDISKAFDNHKALVISANLSSKDFQQADSAESKELQNRLRQVNLRWEKAHSSREAWRNRLQYDLMQCQDFHETSHFLLLWLDSAEQRRCNAQILDPNADPHTLLECQQELMQLEKELLERQPQVNSLQEIAKYLLAKADGDDHVEANERVHVIGNKFKQLLQLVSQDLKSTQLLDKNSTLASFDELDSTGHLLTAGTSTPLLGQKIGEQKVSQGTSNDNMRTANQSEVTEEIPRPRSLFYRVLRAALPLQLLLLLLLLLACMIPFSEEDYSCAHSNNFARSFYPMLRYTNGPPPT